MKTCYTAIFGNYDDLKQPFFTSRHWKYVCFTDQDFNLPEDNVWEIRKVPVMDCGPAKTARWYKINFHKCIETEFSLWIDATFFINIDLNRWWKRFKAPMTCINHPFDDSPFVEIQSCIFAGKGDFMTLAQQAVDYQGVVPYTGNLIASGILMRQKTKPVIELCEEWWSQVEKYSQRDQPCFAYAANKYPDVYDAIDWNYTTAEEFIHVPHIHKSWREARLQHIKKKYGSVQG